jgi:WhiB family transcriptional regulator, redox-sensing transcriptional regulator
MSHRPGLGSPARAATIPAARAQSADWMARGACQAEDPELFFPIAMTGPALDQISLAKAVCNRCEVREPCLSFAVATRQDGIWGGTTRDERLAPRDPPAATADRPRPGPPE